MFHLRSMFAYWFYLWMINKHYVDDHWCNGIFTAAAKLLQLCPTLFDPIDGSPPGSPIPGILQARTLEWVAISFSNAWKWKVKGKLLSHVRLVATPWTAAHQAPPSMGFSRQEYWSGVPLPSPMNSSRWSQTTAMWGPSVEWPWAPQVAPVSVAACVTSFGGYHQPQFAWH